MTPRVTGHWPVVVVMTLLLALAGCRQAPPSAESRRDRAEALAGEAGWQRLALATHPFTLVAWIPDEPAPAKTLTIYIEGDGLAWISRSRISGDPTPKTPLALQLALAHEPGAAAYLARPCQFVTGAEADHCEPGYWTDARFSETVIASSNEAITKLKQHFGADQLRLAGFSGGAAVAALVAARRDDVSGLITVAGNLDHHLWTRHHRISPLDQSLNPADAWQALTGLPQIHFVGADDRIIVPSVAESFRERFPAGRRPPVRVLEGHGHGCCWARDWPALLDEAREALETDRQPSNNRIPEVHQ